MDRRTMTGFARLVVIAGAAASAMAGCKADGTISRKSETPGATGDAGMTPAATTPPPGAGAMDPPAGMGPARPAPGITGPQMPTDVLAILQSRCAGCHTYGQADPAGWGSVLDISRMIASDIVVPGDPGASRLIDRVAVAGDMPPKGERLKADEVALLKQWITELKRPVVQPLSDNDVLDAISVDQLRLRDRSSDYRYVSFAHYLSEGREAEELDAIRNVFVFVLNSLARRGAIVEPEPIDTDKTIYRLRLSELGWDEALWDTITSFYPYCLRSDAVAHEALYAQLRTEAPVVRGDWFLATATKPPLYDQLINLPNTLDQLAAQLGIDIDDDINHPGLAEPDNLVRVGFRRSGVALHNRLLERHLGNQGQYLWISYDFDSNEGRQDLLANPLGPADRDQQDFVHTFEHQGGEAIYTLPNGLQGYMIVDAAGNKLDEVPLTIARDPRRRNGVVENAISCFGCHGTNGLLRPRETDEVARYTDTHIVGFLGRELNEIEATYPRVLRPDIFTADSGRYRALADSVPGGGPPKVDDEYTPFVAITGQYESNVGFRGAAAEFHEEFATFRERVLANDFQNDSLPRTPTAPLVSRDDFVCVFRDIVTKIRPNAVFCDKTFDAAAVVNACSGSRSNSNPAGSGGSSGQNRGTGGSSGSRGTGGSSGSRGTGGAGGSSRVDPPSGGAADAASPPANSTDACRRVNGVRVCQ
jgi:mono/diheme cytochrome c family protein